MKKTTIYPLETTFSRELIKIRHYFITVDMNPDAIALKIRRQSVSDTTLKNNYETLYIDRSTPQGLMVGQKKL